jgi:hypothetical protein
MAKGSAHLCVVLMVSSIIFMLVNGCGGHQLEGSCEFLNGQCLTTTQAACDKFHGSF